ncbi:MAG: response regulator [Proteobacteria bacterium]|nr:response regulator [Pseudomonadota bacterium]MBU1688318.1 response regulator [Pseudomonadota bacterium]
MKSVLIVDDEKNFLLSLADMLKDNEAEFSIKTANDGREASKIINSEQVDLVVTDLNMPEMDGFELMALISQSKPNMPVIAMTAYGTPEMESRLMNMGAFQYIEKPIDYNSLLHKIKDGLKTGTKGHVAGISLPSFMQLLELDKKTCTLTLRSDANIGTMYFQQGEIVAAKTGNLTGQDAAFEIICWENTEIEIENNCRIKEREINVPLGYLLIESARMKDEKNKPEKETIPEVVKEQDAPPPTNVVDVDNIGFLSKPEEEAPLPIDTSSLEPESDDSPETLEEKSAIDALTDTILSSTGVNRLIIISGTGSVLSHNNIPVKEFGGFIAAITGAAIKIKKILGFTGPRSVIVTHSNGEKILILIGGQIVTGIGLDSNIDPDKISEALKPHVSKIKL